MFLYLSKGYHFTEFHGCGLLFKKNQNRVEMVKKIFFD